jgi:hypothetical protein
VPTAHTVLVPPASIPPQSGMILLHSRHHSLAVS